MIHSIKADKQGKYIWFSEFDNFSKKIGRFEIATEQFLEIPLPGSPSTFVVGNDGKVWVTANGTLYEVDAEAGRVIDAVSVTNGAPPIEETAGEAGARPMAQDSAGNVWLSGGRRVTKFNPRTKTFEQFPLPKVNAIPEDYYRNILNVHRRDQKGFEYMTYALALDSHENVWFPAYNVGHIGRLDPRTKEVQMFRIPGALWIKGIEVDKYDNVWFGNFLHGKLGKLDSKIGLVEQYQPPTRYASFYTPVADTNGMIWLSDFSSSKLTKFNPFTKQFTEYPLPESDGMIRFFGVDPRGRVWYVDFDAGKIGILDPGDTVSQ